MECNLLKLGPDVNIDHGQPQQDTYINGITPPPPTTGFYNIISFFLLYTRNFPAVLLVVNESN